MIPLQLITALIFVESGGDDNAIGDNGKSVGCLQITPAVIADVNATVRKPSFYKLEQRTNRAISIQIFTRYLGRWVTPHRLGHEPTLEDMARIWHGGPDGWKRPGAKAYWAKVKKAMEGAR